MYLEHLQVWEVLDNSFFFFSRELIGVSQETKPKLNTKNTILFIIYLICCANNCMIIKRLNAMSDLGQKYQ